MSTSSVTLVDTQVHRIQSNNVDQEFEIRVAMPQQSWGPPLPDAYQTLYVLDGDLFFGIATEMTRLMAQLFMELPPIIVVGIGYGTDQPRVQGELRNRDFTPTANAGFGQGPPPGAADWEPVLPEELRFGHADAFLRFVVDELQPYVSSHLPTTGQDTLFGSSFGGLFALYAMLTRPEAFQNYIVASPGMWWDSEWLLGYEAEVAEARDDLPARLFMGVGELEEPEHMPWLAQLRTVTNVGVMRKRLESRGYSSFQAWSHVFDNETHTSVVPSVLTRGLRALIERPMPPMPGA